MKGVPVQGVKDHSGHGGESEFLMHGQGICATDTLFDLVISGTMQFSTKFLLDEYKKKFS